MKTQRGLKAKKKNSTHELTSSVAHEIKNCLTGIRGCLQVLGEDFPDESPQKLITKELLRDAGRLDIAVKTLLTFAVPPAPSPVPASVNTVIQNVKATLETQLCGPRLCIEFVPRRVPEIFIDPDQLRLGLLNIAYQRIRAAGGEGSIVFAAKKRRGSDEVEISLSDNGTGAAGDFADATPSSGGTGAGPGLAAGRRIIEGLGGRIEVKNGREAGTIVRVVLPAAEKA